MAKDITPHNHAQAIINGLGNTVGRLSVETEALKSKITELEQRLAEALADAKKLTEQVDDTPKK